MEENEQTDAGDNTMKSKTKLAATFIMVLLISGCGYISSTLFYDDPLNAVEHNNLGVAYEREGKNDLAIREYKMAIEQDDKFTVSIINLANVYFKTGQAEKAEKYYKKALRIEPGNITAANNLANLYLDSGKKFEQGIDILTRTIDNPEDMPAYYLDTLGHLYIKSGQLEKGIETLKSACRKIEADTGLRESLDSFLTEINAGGCD